MNERIADLAEILRKSHPRQLDYEAEQTYCPICALELRCYKSKFKDVIDVNLGRFEAREILKVCPKHKYMVIDGKRHVRSFRSSELARLVASGSLRHSYDLMVDVGLRRFQKCRQIREIEEELIDEYYKQALSLPHYYLCEVPNHLDFPSPVAANPHSVRERIERTRGIFRPTH